ncbi:MAG TPA: diguanylate cyclase [Paucimonas sp.]|nr:diguanylate cyclase [Paucimonas sp.]
MTIGMDNFLANDGFAPGVIRILLVDDQSAAADAIARMFHDQPDLELQAVKEGALALPTALKLRPAVILQDLLMPDNDGFAIVRQIREHPATRDIPVIVLSAMEDPDRKVEGFAAGANDYVAKIPDRRELIARVRYHAAAYLSRLQRDEAFRALRESQRRLSEANAALEQLAAVDGLTGIANRRRFDEAIAAEWQRGRRERVVLSVLMCDIDCFKAYNDRHGHLAGDDCLKQVAAILRANLRRPADIAARYGGEEFALILPGTGRTGALAVAEACRRQVEALALPNPDAAGVDAPGGGVVTLSIGFASRVPSAEITAANLIGLADRALYDAKELGRNRVVDAP